MQQDHRTQSAELLLAQAETLRRTGDLGGAIKLYLLIAERAELPEAVLCLKLARAYHAAGDFAESLRWSLRVVDGGEDFAAWQGAADLIRQLPRAETDNQFRSARIAVVSSYTTKHLVGLLRLVALRYRMSLEIYESGYNQYRQEIIDRDSRMYKFKPDLVLLAVHEGELALPDYTDDPDQAVQLELSRWTDLWAAIVERCQARVVQYNFVLPAESPMGHLGVRLAGCRYAMTHALNALLGTSAGSNVSIVDCERLASFYGKGRWIDPRYWYLAKQGVSFGALPVLVRHTAAVISANLGLSRKCLVLDLDNTLWGGVIGEDGLAGIRLGNGVDGEAYVAFQEYILKLKNKGVLLAVCSKNNEATAREPFERHPEMRLRLDDFTAFVANWQPKSENIRRIAKMIDIGVDSLVFVDDDPVERTIVRQLVPEVDVVCLPQDPSLYVHALSDYLLFESSSFGVEDAQRTELYRAKAQIAELEASAGSIEEFYRGLHMQALVAPFDELNLPRIAQLIGKTNQFNLTTRIHGVPQLQAFVKAENCIHFYLRLRDRFADHGLVSLMIGFLGDGIMNIDTWLMSCRVIGRTVEAEMLKQLSHRAIAAGCHTLRGTYIPTGKNEMVRDLYGKFGFTVVDDRGGTLIWQYDLSARGPVQNDFIEIVEGWK